MTTKVGRRILGPKVHHLLSNPHFLSLSSTSRRGSIGFFTNRFLAQDCGATTKTPTSLSFSTFAIPPPNTYNAPAVYKNVDISISGTNGSDISRIRKKDPQAVYVITGASRSMGLEFVKTVLRPDQSHPESIIIACCRSPSNAKPLLEWMDNTLTIQERSRIHICTLDVTSDTDIQNLVSLIEQKAHGRVDLLFNVAGVLGNAETTPGPERNISQFQREWFQSQMDVNAISPMMITAALTPFMKVSRKELKEQSRAPSVVVNLSARVGSIGDMNAPGLGWHSYRMSKVALNMGTRVLSHELKKFGIWTVALYPGFTDTDMSKPFQRPGMKEKGMVFPVDFTVGRLLDVVNGMEEEHSGGFYDWSGIALPY